MENSMEVEKMLKPKKRLLIIGLMILAIAVGLIVTGVLKNQNKYEGVQMHIYNDLISKDADKENMLVKLEITNISPAFAVKEIKNVKRNYYFAIDKNNYWYIVRLTDSTYQELKSKIDSEGENFKYVLRGYIYNDPEELKKLAISAYNQGLSADAEKLTNSNFQDYLGSTYLDETKTPNDSTVTALIGIGIGLAILSSIFLIISISNIKKLKSTLKKYDAEELKEELNNINIEEYKRQSVYLTNKYIISTINGLGVLEYSDILWMYNEKRRQNGIVVGVWIMARTRDNKKILIASDMKEDILIEIMTKIKEKNHEILIGFTGENNKEYKKLLKEIKMEKKNEI